MLLSPPQPLKRSWSPVVIAGVLVVALIGAAIAVSTSGGRPATLRSLISPVNMAAAAWRIDVANEMPQKTGQRFSGKFTPGQLCYLPAGVSFEVHAEPFGACGAFIENAQPGTWVREGGDLGAPIPKPECASQTCKAPNQPGLYHLFWQSPTGPTLPLEVLVLMAAETSVQGDRTALKVNGKNVGAYLDPAQSSLKRVRENAQQYKIPRYFALLTPETTNLNLGPDFDLGSLVAFKDYHGPDGKKVFTTTRHTDVLPLKPELITKLIKLRERLREKNVKVTRFWITSGFRTPDYNRSIGGAAYSRHCYGDAVDLCIDEDDDKHMDDLNGDGKIDRKDGLVIANACRELEAEGAVVPGGIGVYEWDGEDSVRSHVHIDCRGFVSRWGQIGSGRNRKSFTWWPKGEFQEEDGE